MILVPIAFDYHHRKKSHHRSGRNPGNELFKSFLSLIPRTQVHSRVEREYDLTFVPESTNKISVSEVGGRIITVTMSELVKVIVRCRPRNEKEEKMKCQVRIRTIALNLWES